MDWGTRTALECTLGCLWDGTLDPLGCTPRVACKWGCTPGSSGWGCTSRTACKWGRTLGCTPGSAGCTLGSSGCTPRVACKWGCTLSSWELGCALTFLSEASRPAVDNTSTQHQHTHEEFHVRLSYLLPVQHSPQHRILSLLLQKLFAQLADPLAQPLRLLRTRLRLSA